MLEDPKFSPDQAPKWPHAREVDVELGRFGVSPGQGV